MNAASDRLVERIAELEVRVAFQDDLLGTLNATVASADASIRALREEMTRLRQALDSVRVALNPDAGDEPPPPHY